MSIIKTHSGLIVGTKSKALILSPGAEQYLFGPKSLAVNTQADKVHEERDIAKWGEDNLQPYQMVDDIENAGVLNAVIETKARLTVGKGPMLCKVVNIRADGEEELEFVNDNRIKDWMEMSNFFEDSFALAKDLLGTGNPFDQLVLTKDRSEIFGFKRADPTECRFSKMIKGRSEYVYMSADWQRYNDTANWANNEHMDRVPLLDKAFPLLDLMNRKSGHSFMLSMQYPLFGRKYYAMPLWWPAREWVKMSRSIPELKKAMVRNQMNLNYIVEIHPKFWENYDPRYKDADLKLKTEIQDEFYDQVEENLSGGENAYKSLFSTMIVDAVDKEPRPGIKITTIDDKLKEGKLLVDSAAANSEILFANLMNPAIIGADTPGGPYSGGAGSGSNIRESTLSQVILVEMERRLIAKRFSIAKAYNQWDKDLVLRFPNKLLTTLNTGANTKSTA